MSCDYYIRINCCARCGRYEEKEIGHSAIGWPFMCIGVGTKTFEEWEDLVRQHVVYDEYGKVQIHSEFIAFVKGKQESLEAEHWLNYFSSEGHKYNFISSDGFRFRKEDF